MDTILVTGGAGFIGSHLVNELSKENKVVVIDNLSTGKRRNILNKDNVIFIKGDICEQDFIRQVLSTYEFRYIYHLAAIASVAESVNNPNETLKTNFEATVNLLEEARQQKQLERFIFTSSAAVYGDEPTLPKKENSLINPLTPYAIDKFSSERYVLAFYQLYGVKTSVVRFFNVYGPNQNPDSPYSGVISILTKTFQDIIAGKNSKFSIFGEGEQTRDFIYVTDVINALLLVATEEEAIGQVYNVGTNQPVSLNQLITIYEQITNVKLPVQYQQARSGDIKDSYANVSQLKALGSQAKYSLESGLKAYWKYQRETEKKEISSVIE